MQWYVSRNGETSGPVEEAQIAEWIRQRQVGGETYVRDEHSPRWVPIGQSPFSPLFTQQFAPRKSSFGSVIAVVFFAVLAVGWLATEFAGRGNNSSTKEATGTEQPCPDEFRVRAAPLWICDALGNRDEKVVVRDKSGIQLFELDPGVQVYGLTDSTSGPREVKRSPGHVDAKICITEGPHRGTVAWVQNTLVNGHDCRQ